MSGAGNRAPANAVAAQAALLGDNVRVELEDNLYSRRGVFATNGQLVERTRLILEMLG
jgi:uncharacterized protein (DUF849 family)